MPETTPTPRDAETEAPAPTLKSSEEVARREAHAEQVAEVRESLAEETETARADSESAAAGVREVAEGEAAEAGAEEGSEDAPDTEEDDGLEEIGGTQKKVNKVLAGVGAVVLAPVAGVSWLAGTRFGKWIRKTVVDTLKDWDLLNASGIHDEKPGGGGKGKGKGK